jgi:hypothetical protein
LAVLVITLVYGCANASEKADDKVQETNEVSNNAEVQNNEIFISLKNIASELTETGRDSESKILLEMLERDSICLIKNEYSSFVKFEKPIKYISDFNEVENYLVILNASNEADTNYIKIAQPHSYSFSDEMIKGGIGWNIKMSKTSLNITSLEF